MDHVQSGTISGWATDRSRPLDPAQLVFLLGRRIVGIGHAEQRREDVAQALQISVRCGFSQFLPSDALRDPAGISVLAVDPDVARRAAAALKAGGDREASIDGVIGKRDETSFHPLPMGPDALTGIRVSLDRLDPRLRAGEAYNAANWPSAAFFYGKAAALEPHDATLWMRHAEALRRLGLFERSRQSYVRAMDLQPTDAQPVSCLASLSMAQGDLRQAAHHLKACVSLGGSKADHFRRELETVRTSNLWSMNDFMTADTVFFLSCAAPVAPDSDPRELKRFLGAAHYSYSYILQGYLNALEAAGYDCKVISHPEYLPDIREQTKGKAMHIGFYPPDEPRFLKGAYNVTCIAWEFERLRNRTEAKSYHAFSDASTMLRRSDEVWAISGFGAEALRRSGIDQVSAVPTPVSARQRVGRTRRPSLPQLQKAALKLDRLRWCPLAVIPAIQKTMSSQAEHRSRSLSDVFLAHYDEVNPIVFLCVFNVHDYRKQVKPLLEGFVRFAQTNRNAYLLLKATSIDSSTLDINTQLFMYQVADPGELTPPLVSDRVLVTTDTLSRDEMLTLNDLASYYVCTSHAEGQNLPLIEAMATGVVPISVDHTAMRDYISLKNSIVIPSKLKDMTPRLTARYEMYDVGTYFVDPRAVYRALSIAVEQAADSYAALSRAALTTVTQNFGSEPFLAAIADSIGRAKLQAGSN